jgi:hypothetical protein
MKPFWIAVLVAVLAVTAGLSAPVVAVASETFKAKMTPIQEAPVCSSTGSGAFEATLSEDGTAVSYELTYNLEGMVTQAHIHLAQVGVSGGIMVWLCQTSTNVDPTGLSPTCPDPGTPVAGTFTSANVIAVAAQGIAAGEFDEVLRAMRRGLAYANVHSNLCPSGEVRGQILKKHQRNEG